MNPSEGEIGGHVKRKPASSREVGIIDVFPRMLELHCHDPLVVVVANCQLASAKKSLHSAVIAITSIRIL
jgi:hypothetical protein